jgi:hypothetical protein
VSAAKKSPPRLLAVPTEAERAKAREILFRKGYERVLGKPSNNKHVGYLSSLSMVNPDDRDLAEAVSIEITALEVENAEILRAHGALGLSSRALKARLALVEPPGASLSPDKRAELDDAIRFELWLREVARLERKLGRSLR